LALSDRYDVKSLHSRVIPKIGRDQRAAPLQGGSCDPCVCRLDRLAGATTLGYDLGLEHARSLIRIESQVQRHMSIERAPALCAPVVGFRPEHQLGSSHKGKHQLMSSHCIDAGLTERVFSIKQNRHYIRVKNESNHSRSRSVAALWLRSSRIMALKQSTSDGSPLSVGAKSTTGGLSPGIETLGSGRFRGSTTFAINPVYRRLIGRIAWR